MELWDPVLEWARRHLGATFAIAQGVMPIEQPSEAVACYREAVDGLDALRLGALHVMTTLTGSALISLAHARGELDREAAWQAAHVDEDFQIAQWGEDAEASERRAKRWRDFEAASDLFALS